MVCEYGCGREARYKTKNGKMCCEIYYQRCPAVKKIPWNRGKSGCYSENTIKLMSAKALERDIKGKTWEELYPNSDIGERKTKLSKMMSVINKGKVPWNKGIKNCFSDETVLLMRKKAKDRMTQELKDRISKKLKAGFDYYKKKYPFFFKVEKPIRGDYNQILVRCKFCNKIFEPTGIQLYERIRQLEKPEGRDGCYFYCSKDCKNKCPLFNLKSDPNNKKEIYYTSEEYETFRKYVLERDDYICQFCGNLAKIVHHERPQKLEPFFSLDPDYTWSCCDKCHYKYGHKDECSTGNLSSITCS